KPNTAIIAVAAMAAAPSPDHWMAAAPSPDHWMAAAPCPDHRHPFGHCRLNILRSWLNILRVADLDGREALKTCAAKVHGTAGPSSAAEISRRSITRSAANALCFASSAARSASNDDRRPATQPSRRRSWSEDKGVLSP